MAKRRTVKDIDAELAKIGSLNVDNSGATNLRSIARDDGWGAYAKDAVYHLGRGASGIIRGAAAIGDEAANGLSRTFSNKEAGPGFSKIANPLMDGFEKGISGLRSATDTLDEADMQEAIQASKDRGEDWTGQAAAALRTTGLRGASLMAIEQAPGLVPGVGVQKLVRGGMALAGRGATKAGVKLSAKNAARVKTLSGMGEAAIGNAAQSYLSNAGEVVRDNLENGRQWDKGLGEVKKGLYVSAGLGALEHKLGVRAESAILNRMGSKMSGGAGAAVNSAPVPKGGLARRAFGVVKNGVKGSIGGAASEGYTSYSEQKDINRALGRDENEDLGMAVYQGVLGGGSFGGATKMIGQNGRPRASYEAPVTPNTQKDLLGGNPPPSGGSGPSKTIEAANSVLDSIDQAAGDTDGETSAAVKIVREAANASPVVAAAAAKCRTAEDVRSLAQQVKEATQQPQPQQPQAPTAEGQGQALPAGNPAPAPAPQQSMPGTNRPQVAPQPGEAQQAVAQSAPPQAKEINSLNELDQMGFDEVSTLAGGIVDKDGSAVRAFSQMDDGQKQMVKAIAAGASASGKKISGADLANQAKKYGSPQAYLESLDKCINAIATTSVPGGKTDSNALAAAIAERAVLTGECEANPQAIQSYLYGENGVMHMANAIQTSIVNAQALKAKAEKAVQTAAAKLQDAKIKLSAATASKDEKKIAAAQAAVAEAEATLAAAKTAAAESGANIVEGQRKLGDFLSSISGELPSAKPEEAEPQQQAIPATAEGPAEPAKSNEMKFSPGVSGRSSGQYRWTQGMTPSYKDATGSGAWGSASPYQFSGSQSYKMGGGAYDPNAKSYGSATVNGQAISKDVPQLRQFAVDRGLIPYEQLTPEEIDRQYNQLGDVSDADNARIESEYAQMKKAADEAEQAKIESEYDALDAAAKKDRADQEIADAEAAEKRENTEATKHIREGVRAQRKKVIQKREEQKKADAEKKKAASNTRASQLNARRSAIKIDQARKEELQKKKAARKAKREARKAKHEKRRQEQAAKKAASAPQEQPTSQEAPVKQEAAWKVPTYGASLSTAMRGYGASSVTARDVSAAPKNVAQTHLKPIIPRSVLATAHEALMESGRFAKDNLQATNIASAYTTADRMKAKGSEGSDAPVDYTKAAKSFLDKFTAKLAREQAAADDKASREQAAAEAKAAVEATMSFIARVQKRVNAAQDGLLAGSKAGHIAAAAAYIDAVETINGGKKLPEDEVKRIRKTFTIAAKGDIEAAQSVSEMMDSIQADIDAYHQLMSEVARQASAQRASELAKNTPESERKKRVTERILNRQVKAADEGRANRNAARSARQAEQNLQTATNMAMRGDTSRRAAAAEKAANEQEAASRAEQEAANSQRVSAERKQRQEEVDTELLDQADAEYGNPAFYTDYANRVVENAKKLREQQEARDLDALEKEVNHVIYVDEKAAKKAAGRKFAKELARDLVAKKTQLDGSATVENARAGMALSRLCNGLLDDTRRYLKVGKKAETSKAVDAFISAWEAAHNNEKMPADEVKQLRKEFVAMTKGDLDAAAAAEARIKDLQFGVDLLNMVSGKIYRGERMLHIDYSDPNVAAQTARAKEENRKKRNAEQAAQNAETQRRRSEAGMTNQAERAAENAKAAEDAEKAAEGAAKNAELKETRNRQAAEYRSSQAWDKEFGHEYGKVAAEDLSGEALWDSVMNHPVAAKKLIAAPVDKMKQALRRAVRGEKLANILEAAEQNLREKRRAWRAKLQRNAARKHRNWWNAHNNPEAQVRGTVPKRDPVKSAHKEMWRKAQKENANEEVRQSTQTAEQQRSAIPLRSEQEQHPAKQVQPADAGERATRNPQSGERSAGGAKRNPVESHEPGNRADGAGSVSDKKASGRNSEEASRKGKVVKAKRNPSAYTRAVNASKEGDVEATRKAVDEYFANLPEGKKPATQMLRLRENLKSLGDDLFREAANDKPEGPDDPPPNGGKDSDWLLLVPEKEWKPSGLTPQARSRVASVKSRTANVPKKAEGAAAPKGQKSVSSGEGRSTAESVRGELKADPASKAVSKLVDNGTLNIVDREADLPDTVEKDGRTGGYYDPSTSKAYLVAENIAPGDARGVLLHEVGNHMVHDESMTPLDNRACLLVEDGVKRGDPLMQRVADRLKAAGETITSNPQETRAYLTEEAAKMVSPPRGVLGFFRQMKAAVNAWMTKHVGNVPGFRLTPEDMVRIAEAGVQKAAKGERNLSGKIQFSKAMTVTPEMRSAKEVADDGLAKRVLSGKEDWPYALERGLNDRARRAINAMPIPDKAKFAVSKIADLLGKGMKVGLNAVFTRDLVQMARKVMPSAQKWYDSQILRQNIKNHMMESASYVKECFYQGIHSHDEREAAYRFMADATYNQVWWTDKKPDWVSQHQWDRYMALSSETVESPDGTKRTQFTEEKREAFEKARNAWESMSDAQKTAIEEYFKWTYSAKEQEIKALEQLNRDVTHKLIEQMDNKLAEAKGRFERADTPEAKNKAEKRLKKLEAERKALANRLQDIPKMLENEVNVLAAPYAPLRRLGDHLIIGKSKEYTSLENELKDLEQKRKDSPETFTDEDASNARSIRKELDEMKGDGQHYWLDSEDGAFSARNKRDELQRANPSLVFSEPFPVSEAETRGAIRLNQIKNVIDQAALEMADLDVDAEAKDYIMGLSKAANELMVKSMLNSAIQKSQLHRRNVMGFDTNMMRVFDSYSIKQANHVANICTERKQREAMSAMLKEKKSASNEEMEFCTDLYNQFKRRSELLATQDPRHWANKVQRFNAGMMLFTNPGYYFQNATQPFMMSASYMAGNFGMTKVTTEICQVYGQLAKAFTGYFSKPWKLDDLVKDGICNEEELGMLKQLNYENLLEASMKSEYGELNDSENWMARKYKVVSDKFVAVNQRVEMMNRISTALVAYRNAKGSDKVRGMKDAYKNSIISKQFKGDLNAYAYAAEVVYRTHGDYSSLNSPAMMLQGGIHAGGMEKLLFQFRKYQLIQVGSYAHMLKKWFNGATPEERALGKREFLYTMGTNLAMCGLKGSFLVAQLMFLGNWAFGDDDETDEEWTKRMLGNGTAADILVGGLPEFAGLPVSSYIGAGEALSPFGFFRRHDGPGGVGFVEDLAFAVGGPTLSQADKMVRGFGNMWDATNIVTDYEYDPYFKAGQFTKGLETVLPKGFGNAVKAVDQMVNGISSSTGNTQYLSPDEITAWDTFCTAMGIPSSHVSEAYETTGRNYEKLNLLKDKTSEVKSFIKSGDYEAARRAIVRRNKLAVKLNKKPKYYADYIKEIRAAEKRKAKM